MIPGPWLLPLIFVLGACLGSFINLCVYTLAWRARPFSPWVGLGLDLKRSWLAHVPIVGWMEMRKEARMHGRGFWVRPLIVELASGLGLAALYWWEVGAGGLLPPFVLPGGGNFTTENLRLAMHMQFAAHTVLIVAMLIASLIDVDEKIIPDSVTIPGTLLGLILATAYPWCLLPGDLFAQELDGALELDFVSLASPEAWPASLNAMPQVTSLAVASALWLAWCFALLPRRFVARRGWWRGWQMFWSRIVRTYSTWLIAAMAAIGWFAILLAWLWCPAANWAGLLSALVGLGVSGGIIWAVRLVGTAALGREAMGFGDVTLMAMIGTLIGWQGSLVIFFLAPFAGLVIGVGQWVLRRDKEIPYGPFLCLATLALIIWWSPIWDWARKIFALGGLVPIVVIGCLLLMGVLLGIWRGILFLLSRVS